MTHVYVLWLVQVAEGGRRGRRVDDVALLRRGDVVVADGQQRVGGRWHVSGGGSQAVALDGLAARLLLGG